MLNLHSAALDTLMLPQLPDPWAAYAAARQASLKSARKPFKIVALHVAADDTAVPPSPRRNARANGFESEGQCELPRDGIAGLFVAERFRAYLKRANARKPDWL
jgi:hypothetical protein